MDKSESEEQYCCIKPNSIKRLICDFLAERTQVTVGLLA